MFLTVLDHLFIDIWRISSNYYILLPTVFFDTCESNDYILSIETDLPAITA